MTISTYKIENILKAYNKQIKSRDSIDCKQKNPDNYTDVVTLSSNDNRKEVFDKISYGLLDILLKDKK